MSNKKIGISSLGLHFPPLFLDLKDLAMLRNVDPNKYLTGLGCEKMSLCPEGYSVVTLAVEAAKRALSRWHGGPSDIGLIAIGSEGGIDLSRPLSAFVAEQLNLNGAIRSYEVKHACYGGMLALRQAVEWKLSGAARHRAALVIATDIATYKPGDPGEPTQGAGAVAMIIDSADIAEVSRESYYWSKPVYDFWRPLDIKFPKVNGPLSLESYNQATLACFRELLIEKKMSFQELLNSLEALCFHVPFPKMVKKAFMELGNQFGIAEEVSSHYFKDKIYPTMDWNRLTGNSYTASLWVAVAHTLCGLAQGRRISAFSYGSGCGAELVLLTAGPKAILAEWQADVEKDFANRQQVNRKTYDKMRQCY